MAKQMFLVTSEKSPPIIVKNDSVEGATEFFAASLSEKASERILKDPSFKVQPLTLELLDQITDGCDEFKIDYDAGF